MEIENFSFRQQAEEQMKYKSFKPNKNLNESEIEQLLYELELCKIELDLQSKALQLSEERARVSSEKHRILFEKSDIPAALLKLPEKVFVDVNEAFVNLYGYTKDEVLGKSSVDLHIIKPNEAVPDRKFYENDFVCDDALEITIKSGEKRIISYCMRDVQVCGENFIFVSINDITQRKRVEHELRQSHESFAKIFQFNPAALAITRLDDGKFLLSNEVYTKTLGYTREDLAGKRIGEMNIYLDIAEREEIVRLMRKNGRVENHELTVKSKSGELKTILNFLEPLTYYGEECVLTTFLDITEHKKAELELQTSRTIFDAALSSMNDAIFISDTEGRFVHFNEAFATFHKFNTVEECAKTLAEYPLFLDVIFPDGQLAAIENWAVSSALRGESNANAEYTLRRKDTGETWVGSYSYAPIRNSKNEIIGSVVTARDITEQKRAADALRESEYRLSSTMGNMIEGCQILDFDWRYTYINAAAEKHNRRPASEMIGHTYVEMWPGIQETYVYKIIEQCMQERKSYHWENHFAFPDGADGWFELSIQPVPEGVFILSVDITDRKNAETGLQESLEEIKTLNIELERKVEERTTELVDLYNNAPCGYHSLDQEGVFERVNDTELQWLGYQRDELIGRMKITDLMTKESVEIFNQNFPLFKASGHLDNLVLDFKKRDGSIFSALISATVFFDHKQQYLKSRTTLVDYTERKKAEEALQEMHQQLSATNKELEAFSYSVSHDLRAPLRSIDGFSQLLLKDYGPQVDDTGKDYLNRVRNASQRMALLIDNMLQLSRIIHFEMKSVPTDLSAIARSIVLELQNSNVDRHTEFKIEDGLEVIGDPNLLNILLRNLLENSWKYSSKKENSKIEFGRLENDPKIYYVRDNGAGFDMKYAGKLFGAFQRLHAVKEFEGTGIGLATVQRIINRHNGKVWAEGILNQGATFYFSI